MFPSQKSPLPPVLPVGMTKGQIVESGFECWFLGLELRNIVEGNKEGWRCPRYSCHFVVCLGSVVFVFCFDGFFVFFFFFKSSVSVALNLLKNEMVKCLEILFEVSDNFLLSKKE